MVQLKNLRFKTKTKNVGYLFGNTHSIILKNLDNYIISEAASTSTTNTTNSSSDESSAAETETAIDSEIRIIDFDVSAIEGKQRSLSAAEEEEKLALEPALDTVETSPQVADATESTGAEAKADALFARLKKGPLKTFSEALDKALQKDSHKEAGNKMKQSIADKLRTLSANPSKAGRAQFETDVNQLMDEHKKAFKDDFSILRAVKNAVNALIGAVIFVLTLSLRGQSFFNFDTPTQRLVQAQRDELLKSVDDEPGFNAALGANI